MSVPADLRGAVGLSEVTKALGTSDKRRAGALALSYAARVKLTYTELREALTELDEDKLKALMVDAKHKLKLDDLQDQHAKDFAEERQRHRAEIRQARLQGENDALRQLVEASGRAAPGSTPLAMPAPLPVPAKPMTVGAAGLSRMSTTPLRTPALAAPAAGSASSPPAPASVSPPPPPSPKVAPAPSPTFDVVVAAFLKGFPKKKQGMLRKHGAVLPLLLQVVGPKPVAELRQADLNRFFEVVHRLPPRWVDQCRRRGVTALALAAEEHPIALGEKTFLDTYKACVRAFLKAAKIRWQDEGFPITLTTEGIEYTGDRLGGEKKQRAFHAHELERIFRGPEMAAFSADATLAHQYWLPYLGLYTGARVNELCQLNPQTDVRQEPATGIWYFDIEEENDADVRVEKSVKNTPSFRKVPVHSALVKLGFLAYLDALKPTGAKLLFPPWTPTRGRASPAAEKWFIQFIKDVGLRDETAGARIVGMHAFRSTLLNRALNASPRLDATPITGHTGDEGAVVRGYQGELSLTNKQAIIEAIPFGI